MVSDMEKGVGEGRDESTEGGNDGGSNQMEHLARQKWSYIICAYAVVGVSLIFFRSDILRSHLRSPILVMDICLASVCVFLLVVLCIVYRKIEEELRLKAASGENNDHPPFAATEVRCQLLLFILTAALVVEVYLSIAINLIHRREK